jgi:hypothetical protein
MSGEMIIAASSLPDLRVDNESDAITALGNTKHLKKQDREKIIKALQSENLDIAAEFVWNRALVFLKTELFKLGAAFLGELLSRTDIADSDDPTNALSNYEAINLAADLGMISKTAAIRLRQSTELLGHFSHPDTTEDIERSESMLVLSNCIKFVLRLDTLSVPLKFAEFRNSLVSHVLDENTLALFGGSPYFAVRTILRSLLADIKRVVGVQLETALANLNLMLPIVWNKVSDDDRFYVGVSYAELVSDGKKTSSIGIKAALLKVHGFDFVPENLRSETYKKAANNIFKAHDEPNNFYNEPAAVESLVRLGTMIPSPAFPICATAVLCVYLGNEYGISYNAMPNVENILQHFTPERWISYLSHSLEFERRILTKLQKPKPAERWITLKNELNLVSYVNNSPRFIQSLLRAKSDTEVSRAAQLQLNVLEGS